MSFLWNTFQFFHSFYWLPVPLTACEQCPPLIFLRAYENNFELSILLFENLIIMQCQLCGFHYYF